MKVVYIAAQIPLNNNFVKEKSKVMPQYAADHVSRLFFEGLQIQKEMEIEAVNILPIASWPSGSKSINIPRMDWNEDENEIEGLGYCNVVGIRQYSKYHNLCRSFKKHIKEWNEEEVCIVAYGLSTPVLKAFKYLKSMNSNIKTCMIVPDLPQYMNIDGSKFYHWMKKIDIEEQKKLFRYIDGMVYFSKYMNDFFSFPTDKWMVIEGMVDYKESPKVERERKENDKKVILYSGAVEKAYGINDLLEAFMKIEKDDYELQIIGGGSGVSDVEEAVIRDKRIKYLGVMAREDVLEYQRRATLLVNPRKAEQIFTKYSFPSKTFEYMMSGTPVLMHRLAAVPQEYGEYLAYFKNNDVDQMAIQIEEMCEESIQWRRERGKAAQQFVYCQKNNKIQISKLCDFIKLL